MDIVSIHERYILSYAILGAIHNTVYYTILNIVSTYCFPNDLKAEKFNFINKATDDGKISNTDDILMAN